MRLAFKISAIAFALVLPLATASDRSMLKLLNLKKGQTYASAKARLVKGGWKVDTEYSNIPDTGAHAYNYKEVVCGKGWDAVCSVRFLRDDQEVMLTLRPRETLVVDGAWDDK